MLCCAGAGAGQPPPGPPPAPSSALAWDPAVVVAACLAAVAAVVFVVLFVTTMCTVREHPWERHLKGTAYRQYSLQEIRAMTRDFRERRLLGRGALWAVYRAQHSRSKVPCAVKVHTEVTTYSFEKEILAVSSLRHRNLVGLLGYCVGVEQGHNILVYEFDAHNLLYTRLHPEGKLPVLTVQQRLHVARGVAEGLQHLHAHNIIYCDVVPTNVVVSAEGEAKLADFGFLREIEGSILCMDRPSFFTDYLSRNQGYLDPDQGTRSRVGWKVDVFRLGVLLLELMTARRSVVGKSDRALALVCQEALAAAQAKGSAGSGLHGGAKGTGAGEGGYRQMLGEGPMHIREWVMLMRSAGMLSSLLDPRMPELESLAQLDREWGPSTEHQRHALELYFSLALSCCGPADLRVPTSEVVTLLGQIEGIWRQAPGQAKGGDTVVLVPEPADAGDGIPEEASCASVSTDSSELARVQHHHTSYQRT